MYGRKESVLEIGDDYMKDETNEHTAYTHLLIGLE
tara:strand:- start:4 stop:108 length:105 start_codon:yes stop_codon:yes gene_type:complete